VAKGGGEKMRDAAIFYETTIHTYFPKFETSVDIFFGDLKMTEGDFRIQYYGTGMHLVFLS
jgi:hypothetical protein